MVPKQRDGLQLFAPHHPSQLSDPVYKQLGFTCILHTCSDFREFISHKKYKLQAKTGHATS